MTSCEEDENMTSCEEDELPEHLYDHSHDYIPLMKYETLMVLAPLIAPLNHHVFLLDFHDDWKTPWTFVMFDTLADETTALSAYCHTDFSKPWTSCEEEEDKLPEHLYDQIAC